MVTKRLRWKQDGETLWTSQLIDGRRKYCIWQCKNTAGDVYYQVARHTPASAAGKWYTHWLDAALLTPQEAKDFAQEDNGAESGEMNRRRCAEAQGPTLTVSAAYDAAREAGATDIFLRIDHGLLTVRGIARGSQVFFARVFDDGIALKTLDGKPLDMKGVDALEVQMFGSIGGSRK